MSTNALARNTHRYAAHGTIRTSAHLLLQPTPGQHRCALLRQRCEQPINKPLQYGTSKRDSPIHASFWPC